MTLSSLMRAVMSVVVCFIPATIAVSQDVSSAYALNDSLLTRGRTLQDEHQLLQAAKIFKAVQLAAKDSSQIAEALYRFVSCGDAQTELIDSGTGVDQVPDFRSLGLNIVYLQWNESWVNADTSIRQLLTHEFPFTPWGEAAAYDLIHSADRYPNGMYKVDHPRIVLQRAQEFLNRYPHSKYRFDAEHLLAFALKDLWDLSVEGEDEFLTSDERANAESNRTQAIQHFENVSNHRRQLLKEPWKKVDDKILARLRDRQDSGIGYFLVVD